MKKLALISMLFATGAFAHTQGIVQEEVYIKENIESAKKLAESHPDLTIDHLTSTGFELYGPKGMKKWLKEAGVSFEEVSHSHTHGFSKGMLDFAFDYPSFEENTAKLKKLAQDYPKQVKLFSIGKSVNGRDLWVVKISKDAHVDEVKPEFKYISSMHGDEITGRELLIKLMQDMLKDYGKDSAVTELIDNTEIFIMPSMNPDGSEKKTRHNANYVDLNRNFPDWFEGDENTDTGRQPEVKAVMKFQAERKFSLSANYHGGTIVANYPWDNTYDRHPLDHLVKGFSQVYSDLNPDMRSSREFAGGVTNGADWYKVSGGMQDWSYAWYNDLQITIEVSHQKWPRYKDIPSFYKNNKEAMIKYMGLIHQGAGFKFSDKSLSGKVSIKDLSDRKNLGIFGFGGGEFYKVLEPGEYEYSISFDNGSPSQTINVVVAENKISSNGNYIEL